MSDKPFCHEEIHEGPARPISKSQAEALKRMTTQLPETGGGQGMPENTGASPLATGLAGAEAPEPHSRLGPTGGIPSAVRVVCGHRLTAAQQAFLLFLPANGSWMRTTAHDLEAYGRNALRGFGKSGLIKGYYMETMQHRLTDEGVRVARKLRAAQAIEARQRQDRETGLGPEGESAVAATSGDAPKASRG